MYTYRENENYPLMALPTITGSYPNYPLIILSGYTDPLPLIPLFLIWAHISGAGGREYLSIQVSMLIFILIWK